MGGWPEAKRGRWRVEEALLDAVDGALGENVDAVDYVVEKALTRWSIVNCQLDYSPAKSIIVCDDPR